MSELRDEIIRQVDRAHSFEGDEHTFIDSDDIADAILELVHDVLTIIGTMAARDVLSPELDSDWPAPADVVASRAIAAALEVAGVTKGENDDDV